jgi:hypothetical protein
MKITSKNFEAFKNKNLLMLHISKEYMGWKIFDDEKYHIDRLNQFLNKLGYESLDVCLDSVFPELRKKINTQSKSIDYISFEDIVNKWIKHFTTIDFLKVMDFSNSNSIYFELCSYKVYQNSIKERYNEFLKLNFDNEYSEFLEIEYNNISRFSRCFDVFPSDLAKKLNISKNKKEKFIKEELNNIGFHLENIEYGKYKLLPQKYFNPPEENNEFITENAIALLLSETGILEYLKHKLSSNNQSSSNLGPIIKLLSIITQIKRTNLQPYLNAIDKESIYDSRHPKKSLKAVTLANATLKALFKEKIPPIEPLS